MRRQMGKLERYSHALAGLIIFAFGAGIVFLAGRAEYF